MSYTLSPNMSLVIPGVGTQGGPQYASDINASLTIIDNHTHTAGAGAAITPAALNINALMDFQQNFAINVAGVTFYAQATAPAVGTAYRNGDDLYFVDGLGNDIRITESGGVAGTPGSIANLVPPASASYVSGSSTFVFQSAANVSGNIDGGSIILRNLTLSSNGVTISAPAALAANYSLTLPASLPGVTSIMALNSSGAISTTLVSGAQIDSLTITAGNIANNAITTAKIPDLAVTNAKLAIPNIDGPQISSFSTASTSFVDMGLTATITTTGRATLLSLGPFGGGGNKFYAFGITYEIRLERNGSNLMTVAFDSVVATQSNPGFTFLDSGAPAGTNLYKLYLRSVDSNTVQVNSFQLTAIEL